MDPQLRAVIRVGIAVLVMIGLGFVLVVCLGGCASARELSAVRIEVDKIGAQLNELDLTVGVSLHGDSVTTWILAAGSVAAALLYPLVWRPIRKARSHKREEKTTGMLIDQELRNFRVRGRKHIYKGAFVGLSSGGYAQPLTAGDLFAGIAYEEIDNSNGSDGDLSVGVYTLGDFSLGLNGATVADIGRPVFASADDTLTFTATGNSYVGVVQDLICYGDIILRIESLVRVQADKTAALSVTTTPSVLFPRPAADESWTEIKEPPGCTADS